MNDETCGIIITDHEHLLICHPTNGSLLKGWSIPKGIKEKNESAASAAIRECLEETSLIINEDNLIYIGTFVYREKKDMSIFLYSIDEMININTLKCTSTFTNKYNENILEIDGFKIIHKSEISKYLNPKQAKIIEPIFSLI